MGEKSPSKESPEKLSPALRFYKRRSTKPLHHSIDPIFRNNYCPLFIAPLPKSKEAPCSQITINVINRHTEYNSISTIPEKCEERVLVPENNTNAKNIHSILSYGFL